MASLPKNFKDVANQRFLEAQRFWANWRTEAMDDYAFVAGDQWMEEDVQLLTQQRRPPITFNYSEKMIDAVCGAEVSNRQEITYRPRTLDDYPKTELYTAVIKWVRDQGDIEDEETEAFRDCLICGTGWTHTRVSYDSNPDGMIETSRVDPLEMFVDPSAVKPGFSDRRYTFRLVWVEESEARREWGDKVDYAVREPMHASVSVERRGDGYNDATRDASTDQDMHRGQIPIRHYECVEQTPFYRAATPNGIVEFSSEEFTNEIRNSLDQAGVKYIKQYRRTYYYGYFAGETLLEGDLSPCQTGFTYQAITGKRDRNRNTWYGLTKVMKDPQRWANKWLSQILHIINSNAKGGLIAEVGAFVDPQAAAEEWSQPESITILKEGGINKIQQKQATAYPSGLDRLMEFALSSLPQVTGINLEALGLAARDQANVLEQSRKQAAYGLLAPIFDALRRYRKQQGRILLEFVNKYISDGRMIRIGGDDSAQFIPLIHQPGTIEYDVIVDQSPNAPDIKEKTWNILQTLLPAAMKAGMPVPPDILDYTDLPSRLVMDWKQYIQQNHVGPDQIQQMQQQMQQMQQKLQQTFQENQQLKTQLQDKSQSLAQDQQRMILEHNLKMQNSQRDFELRSIELAQQFQMKQAESDANFALKQREVNGNIDARMHEVMHAGANEASANIMGAINKLIETIGNLENDANSQDNTSQE